MPVSFQEILTAFEFAGMSGDFGTHQAILCRRTGKIYCRSEFSDLDEEDRCNLRVDLQRLLDTSGATIVPASAHDAEPSSESNQ